MSITKSYTLSSAPQNPTPMFNNLKDKFCSSLNLPTLSDTAGNLCEHPLTPDECPKALKELPNNKSLEVMNLLLSSINSFGIDISDLVINSFKLSYETGRVVSQIKIKTPS